MQGMGFDGRWLVWSEAHSFADPGDWDIWAWDSASGQIKHVASAPRIAGETMPGPFVIPAVSKGKAAWLQARPSDDGAPHGEMHLYSLAEGQDRVISPDALLPFAFWGQKLLWFERNPPGQGEHKGYLVMTNATTGEREVPPQPLASIWNVGNLAAREYLVVWGDPGSVWLWRPGESESTLIYRAGLGDHVDFPRIAGDLITWRGTQAHWAADLRSGSVARITQGPGDRYMNGNALLISEPVGPIKSNKEWSRKPASS